MPSKQEPRLMLLAALIFIILLYYYYYLLFRPKLNVQPKTVRGERERAEIWSACSSRGGGTSNPRLALSANRGRYRAKNYIFRHFWP